MDQVRFREVQGILDALRVATNGHLGNPIDLKNLQPEQVSTERKYLLGKDEREMPVKKLEFASRLLSLQRDGKLQIERSEPYGGVDVYFSFGSGDLRTLQRIRFGSNRPAQWSSKLATTPENEDGYGQFNVQIRHEDIQKVFFALHSISRVAVEAKHFVVGQSGEFWFVKDSEGHLVEVVIYKVGRAEREATSPLHLMVEVAPWNWPSPDLAVKILNEFEEMLDLKGKQMKQHIAEMFG